MDSPRTVGIVGAGSVGQALARLLVPRFRVLVASRTNAHRAAEFAGSGARAVSAAELATAADCAVIAVPDGAVPAVAGQLAGDGARVVLQTCGALGPSDLGLPREATVSAATFHPLQTCPDAPSAVRRLPGATVGVCGEGPALKWCHRLARAIGCTPMRVAERKLPLYHAAAVLASNCAVGVLDASLEALRASGIGRERAHAALGPLVTASVGNAITMGTRLALAGPVARGDATTVGRHVEAVRDVSEPLADLYVALSARLVDIALRAGLGEAEANAVLAALDHGRQP